MDFDKLMIALYRSRIVRGRIFKNTEDDCERAHEWAMRKLQPYCESPRKRAWLRAVMRPIHDPINVFGIEFPNRVGLAAGYDKNAVALPAFEALGFGFVVVGTVTRYQQYGNERPRQWRLVGDEALVNKMGFNNDGVYTIRDRLAAIGKIGIPVWVSIGKSKDTRPEDAAQEYALLAERLLPYADVLEINVTSPNTPGLRNLLESRPLREILTAVQGINHALFENPKPVVLKLSSDSSMLQIDHQVDVALGCGVNGFTTINTTVRRGELGLRSANVPPDGGLSGSPLFPHTLKTVEYVASITHGRIPIIAVGGITTTDDVKRVLDAGASLIQIFTALPYNGPFLVRVLAKACRDYERST